MPPKIVSRAGYREYPLYSQSQTGWVIIFSFFAAMAIASISMIGTTLFPPWPLAILLLVIGLFFYKLTVTVDDEKIQVTFGLGLKMNPIAIADISTAEAVEYPWFHGYGIRMGWKGVMYNVSGRHAIHLKMKDGYVFRIGTADPRGLLLAIQTRMESLERKAIPGR